MRQGGPQSWSEYCGVEKKICHPCWESSHKYLFVQQQASHYTINTNTAPPKSVDHTSKSTREMPEKEQNIPGNYRL
jgi:hypothetical protein